MGRRLEEIFIVTNRHLIQLFEDENETALAFYLGISDIKDAYIIWCDREQIMKDIYMVMCNEYQKDQDINEFIEEVFDDIVPYLDMSSITKRIKTGSVRYIKLIELLNAVWKFIHTKQGETFTEIKKRLKEEITESMGVCTSGICAHLVCVIQGYFDEEKQPSLKMKMAINDELKAHLTQNINKLAMEQEIDPLMDAAQFKILLDEYIENSAKDILSGFTDQEIKMNGISKQLITNVAYKIYGV